MSYPEENIVVPKPVHTVPFEEYEIELVPLPSAIHKLFTNLIPYPADEKIVEPIPVHCVPL